MRQYLFRFSNVLGGGGLQNCGVFQITEPLPSRLVGIDVTGIWTQGANAGVPLLNVRILNPNLYPLAGATQNFNNLFGVSIENSEFDYNSGPGKDSYKDLQNGLILSPGNPVEFQIASLDRVAGDWVRGFVRLVLEDSYNDVDLNS